MVDHKPREVSPAPRLPFQPTWGLQLEVTAANVPRQVLVVAHSPMAIASDDEHRALWRFRHLP